MQNDRTPQNQQLAAALDTRTKNPRVGLDTSPTVLFFNMLESLCRRNPVVVPRLFLINRQTADQSISRSVDQLLSC